MKFKYAEFVFVVVIFIVTIFNMFGFASDGIMNKTEALPDGSLVCSIPGKDKNVVLNMYVASLSGVGDAVRGEVVYADSGDIKNIYWHIGTSAVSANWLDEDTVEINGNIVDINGEPFDSRGRIDLPDASLKNIIRNKM